MNERSAKGAKTLPGKYYADPEIFAEETRRIFDNSWLYVAHCSELPEPGSYLLHQHDRDSVIVLRDREGELRAYFNVCRHRGTALCDEQQGRLPGAIQCPYHAWTWELDGRLRSAPTMASVAAFSAAELSLRPVALAQWHGFLFLNFATQPEPFEQALASLPDYLVTWRTAELSTVERRTYELRANWKLVFQNFSECYHCPVAHPALSRLTPYKSSWNDVDEGPVLGGPMRMGEGIASMTTDGQRAALPIPGIKGDDLTLVRYYTIFPSMFLSPHPDFVVAYRIEALAFDHTRIHCDWFFHPQGIEDVSFDPEKAVSFWDQTNREDWQLCERAQRGVSSRAYQPGPYSDMESVVAAFDRHYLAVMERGNR